MPRILTEAALDAEFHVKAKPATAMSDSDVVFDEPVEVDQLEDRDGYLTRG